jgi:serine/threonine-protein kinase PknK
MPPELTSGAAAEWGSGSEWGYRPLERVGRGGSGSVWLARDGRGARVALKVAHDGSERSRFASEATRLALALSPALPALFEIGFVPTFMCSLLGAPPGAPYLALEWVDGMPLDPAALCDADRVAVALVVARDLGRALADLHAAGLAHGDIKPENVLFDAAARRARPVDLGLSELVTERRVIGATPRYLAPEYRGTGSDARARDLWALGLTLAELADQRVAQSDDPAERVRTCQLDPRLERLVRPLLRAAGGARPAADWVHRQAAHALGERESSDERRLRALTALRRAYLSIRRPWLERAARGDTLELRVAGLAEQWLARAAAIMADVGRVRGVTSAAGEHRRLVVEDLGALDQERLLLRLIGPSERALGKLAAASDAELLELLSRSIDEQTPRNVAGLVLPAKARAAQLPDADDPVAISIALSQGVPSPQVLERAEQYLERHPSSHSLGLLVARTHCLQHQLGRALGILDQLGGLEAGVEAAEIARRAEDDADAERRLRALDLDAAPPHVRARALATWARLALNSGDASLAHARLEAAPEDVATLEASAMAFIRSQDFGAAERCLARSRSLTSRAEDLARLEFLTGRVAHARHQYDTALECFARAADYAVRAGAVLEEATYLSGVAASATELGQIARALNAAGRALILYEHLGHPERAARAALSRASVLIVANAREEASEAAEEALRLAQHSGDVRCQAYAHLALAEARIGEAPSAGEHLALARELIGRDAAAAELRIDRRLGVRPTRW